jgi:ribosomal protein S6 kinase alpha-5
MLTLVDWWSVGVLTYELLTGASPFTVEGEKNTQQEISRRILKSHPPIPEHLSYEVQDLIRHTLVKDPRKRLGGGLDDALEIKKHPFFKSLNWDDLANRRVDAPFVPKITGELDVSNFAEEFTSMIPADSPAVIPPNDEKIFKGYSYVAPSVLFSENVISDEIFLCDITNHHNRQSLHCNSIFGNTNTNNNCSAGINCKDLLNTDNIDISHLLASKFRNSPFFQNYDLKINSGVLGDGSFSVCRKCINKKTGMEFAVKIVSRKIDTTKEIQLLRSCQGHNNIVNLIEVFHDEVHTYIVLELLKGGELLDRIRRKSRFTEVEAGHIFRGLASATAFMHSKGIVHRDLKPEVTIT